MLRSSHYQNFQTYFFPNMHGCHGNLTQRFLSSEQQNDKLKLPKSTVFPYFIHAKPYLFLLFSIHIIKETTLTKQFCIIITFSSRITMATSCREVYQTFRVHENFHIFSKFENLYKKNCRPIWSLQFISSERVSYVGTYKKKISVGTS